MRIAGYDAAVRYMAVQAWMATVLRATELNSECMWGHIKERRVRVRPLHVNPCEWVNVASATVHAWSYLGEVEFVSHGMWGMPGYWILIAYLGLCGSHNPPGRRSIVAGRPGGYRGPHVRAH